MKNKSRNSNKIPKGNHQPVRSDFVCTECYSTNNILEDSSNRTRKFNYKHYHCSTCGKKTNQMCLGDKSVTARELEFIQDKTHKEEKAYQLVKKSSSRINNESR